MTDLRAALPPKPLPAESRPAPGSGLENMPGGEGDHVDTGRFWSSDDGPSFAEFLDIVNPLQHIPVVSTLYRAITGDDIGPGPRAAGGMLFGGPVGAIVAGVTALFEEASGGDIGEHIASLIEDFTGDGEGNAPNVADAAQAGAPSGPQTGAQRGPQASLDANIQNTNIQTGAELRQTAALAGPAAAPTAGILNRIAVNPSAAMGVAQGPVQKNVLTASTRGAHVPFPARPMTHPFGAPAALPATSRSTVAPTAPPTARPVLRPAVFTPPSADAAPPAREPAQPPATRKTIAAPQVSEAVSRSRRQQADLMLAQWAAQQMARQNDAPAASAQNDAAGGQTAEATPTAGAAHPMLPPRNASPEWYAQAMDQALNRYRNGASAGTGGTPGVSLRR